MLAERDAKLQEAVPAVSERGFRWVDDFYFAAESRDEADRVLGHWERLLSEYRLHLNATKTVILERPEPIEPEWRLQLVLFDFNRGLGRDDRMLNFASLTHHLAGRHRNSPIYSYAAQRALAEMNKLEKRDLTQHWNSLLPFLLTAASADQSSLPKFHRALELALRKDTVSPKDRDRIATAMYRICDLHAPRDHGYEVVWALSILRIIRKKIPNPTATQISGMSDNFARLLLCDAIADGRAPGAPTIESMVEARQNGQHNVNWLFNHEVGRWVKPSVGDMGWTHLREASATFMNLEKLAPAGDSHPRHEGADSGYEDVDSADQDEYPY